MVSIILYKTKKHSFEHCSHVSFPDCRLYDLHFCGPLSFHHTFQIMWATFPSPKITDPTSSLPGLACAWHQTFQVSKLPGFVRFMDQGFTLNPKNSRKYGSGFLLFGYLLRVCVRVVRFWCSKWHLTSVSVWLDVLRKFRQNGSHPRTSCRPTSKFLLFLCLFVFVVSCWTSHRFTGDTVDGRNPANQLIGSLSRYLQCFIHVRWCRISSINSIMNVKKGRLV